MPNPGGNPQNLRPRYSGWRHTPTQAIRVPAAFAEAVRDYAAQLDREEASLSAADLERARQLLNEALALRANSGGAIKAKIREALEYLPG